ncbi:MAG TPA: methyltransferase domain-containing protein, partial [Isosphaeraceae bacterium]|nr:methyltransferase domain-containing protein [Isosphaeraceae bacterium]
MRAEAPARTAGHACPACRGPVDGESCARCGRSYPTVAGLPDFRLESDRYLDLDAERAKAERLARIAASTDLEGVARAYYAITPDVDPPRCARYLAHILGAEARGEAIADRLDDDGPILEVGCGTGGLLVAAARRGLEITGVDIASRWLVVAGRRLDDRGLAVPLVAASAERLPWPDGTFAAIVADSVIEHCDDPIAALREWRRLLRPGGRLVLWSPNRLAPVVDPHVRLWGIGLLPRAWANAYSRLRRGGAWVPRTLSSRGASTLARRAGFEAVSVGPAPMTRSWAMSEHGRRRRAMLFYERLRGFGPTRGLLGVFGPIWALEARAPSRRGGPLGNRIDPGHTAPTPSPFREATRSGLAVCLGAEAIAGACGFGATIHLARRLGPAGFTSLEVALAISAWLLVLVRGGLDQIVVREAARRPRLIGRLTGLLLALRLAWATVAMALIWLIAPFAGVGPEVVAASGLVLLTSALVADVGPRARNELPLLAVAQVARAVGLVGFVTLMVNAPDDLVRAAVAPGVAEGLVALLFAVRAVRTDGWPLPRWSARAAGVFSRRAAVAGLMRFVRVGLYAADAIALGFALGPALASGAYAVSRRVVFALVAVGVVVPTLLAPALARARSRGRAEASAEVGRGLGLLLGLFVPAALGLMLIADRVLPSLFGPVYRDGSGLLALVAARLPVLLAATWLGSALVALGTAREALRATALAGLAALVALP